MLPTLPSIAERLIHARTKKGLSQAALAAKLGVSQGAIEKAENGRTIKPKFLPEAAKILDVSYEWLAYGENAFASANEPSRQSTGFSDAPLVPVYGYASGASTKVAINEGAVIERVRRHNPHMGSEGFYLIIAGDSMEPRYEQGERIAVSRVMPPRKGKDCVIEFIDGTAAVKRFLSQNAQEVVCQQLNPPETLRYKMKEVVAVYAVVGHEF